MNDLTPEMRRLLERQTEWQKSRSRLPWPEKLRLALEMREAILEFRRLRSGKA